VALAAKPASAPRDSRRQVISFLLEPELMGFDLHHLDKVIEVPEFSFVPRVPAFIRGAVGIRGKVVAVVDLREFFGMPRNPITLDSRVLVLASDVYHVGFLVDRAERIESVPVAGPLVQTPEHGDANPYVAKVINLGGRILNLVDVEKLLSEIENYFA
jgi:purine-binding chemotaxis protein CheW